MDSQVVELLGKNRLTNDLLRAGLEVARPERDRGVDLIAYADLAEENPRFRARPIQMKASRGEQFSIQRKYERISDLILAFVWHVEATESPIYALPHDEAIRIGAERGWTATPSWTRDGHYTTQKPPRDLKEQLAYSRATPERWRALIQG
jgi:hypothetical protein